MNLTADLMRRAFESLEKRLPHSFRLIIGGGGAMVLAHHFRLATSDIDGVPAAGGSIEELDPFIKAVAKDLSLPVDWLNPYFATFTHVLPSDYGTRLIRVCDLPRLQVDALSKEDLLIMKCFAARQKDVLHARTLIHQGARLDFVRNHLETLKSKKIPGAEKASNFLHELEMFFEERE
jgi:Nucleotidyltransferase of unknown function (DUF6036)